VRWLSRAPCVALALALASPARAAPPADAVIARIAKLFDERPLVMIGELHRWAELHAFMREMLRDPRFACRVDDVVVEFGNSRLQKLADAYAQGQEVTEAQLQSLWRETVVPLTWNSPVYRQIYETVRAVNQKRLCPHPVRIVLADPPLDWSKIRTVKDYAPWTDRDGSFAAVVEREVLAKGHRAFLLAGLAHAVKRAPDGVFDGPTAAQLIDRAHPGSLFVIAVVPTPKAAEELRMGPPPSFEIVRGSALATADFRLFWRSDPEKAWPTLGEVADGVLYVGAQTLVYPPPEIYLDPDYQRELRRHAAIIKDYSGQDFLTVIDGLVEEARKARQRN
jgi:hypothetical protein